MSLLLTAASPRRGSTDRVSVNSCRQARPGWMHILDEDVRSHEWGAGLREWPGHVPALAVSSAKEVAEWAGPRELVGGEARRAHLAGVLLQGHHRVRAEALVVLRGQVLQAHLRLHRQDGAVRRHSRWVVNVGSGAILQLDGLQGAGVIALCGDRHLGEVLGQGGSQHRLS